MEGRGYGLSTIVGNILKLACARSCMRSNRFPSDGWSPLLPAMLKRGGSAARPLLARGGADGAQEQVETRLKAQVRYRNDGCTFLQTERDYSSRIYAQYICRLL